MAGDLPGHFPVRKTRQGAAAACLPRSLRSRVCRNDAAEKFAGCRKFFFIIFVHAMFTTSLMCLFTNVFDAIVQSPASSCVCRVRNAD